MQRHDPALSSPRRAIVVSPDRQLAAELEPFLVQHLGGLPLTHHPSYPTPRDILHQLGPSNSQIIFLDIPSSPEQALAVLAELSGTAGTQVLAVLAGNDPDSILKCLRAGASDFLLRPITADQVQDALGKLARLQPAPADSGQQSKIISVMPAKGACGATTLACNLAFQWKRMGAKVLLADLDPLAGTTSFLLKLKSTFSFMDILQRGHELDADLWRTTVTSSGGIDILLAPDLAATGIPQFTDASPILNFARNMYDVIVVDTGNVYGEWNLSQARMASELLLVTTNELPALQAAQRALSYLEANKIGKWKTRLVVNRYQRDVGLNRDVIGTALHTEVFETIPSDYDAVQAALMEGKPVPPTTGFGKGVVQLANRLGGPENVSPKKTTSSGGGGLSGLLGGLFSKTKK